MRFRLRFLTLLMLPCLAAGPQCLILDDDLPGQDRKITESLKQALYDAGESANSINAKSLSNANALANMNLLVLPCARAVPLAALPQIEQFLKNGGKLIACGLPLCADQVFRGDGKWMTAAEYEQLVSHVKPARMLTKFNSNEVAKWVRSTNSDKSDTIESVDDALHVAMPQLVGWTPSRTSLSIRSLPITR